MHVSQLLPSSGAGQLTQPASSAVSQAACGCSGLKQGHHASRAEHTFAAASRAAASATPFEPSARSAMPSSPVAGATHALAQCLQGNVHCRPLNVRRPGTLGPPRMLQPMSKDIVGSSSNPRQESEQTFWAGRLAGAGGDPAAAAAAAAPAHLEALQRRRHLPADPLCSPAAVRHKVHDHQHDSGMCTSAI